MNRRSIQGRRGKRLILAAPPGGEGSAPPQVSIGISPDGHTGDAIQLDPEAAAELRDWLMDATSYAPPAPSAEPETVACWVTPPGTDEWHWAPEFQLGSGLVRTLCGGTTAVQAIDTTLATQPSDCPTCVARLDSHERREHLRVVSGGGGAA